MDRRQLLFEATALGSVANLNLDHLLIAQVGKATMRRGRISSLVAPELSESIPTMQCEG
jgi:hypothetical protein